MDDVIRAFAGNGRYRIEAFAVRCGKDWSVTVCGGEKHHVGAVALAQYEPERDSATVSTVTVYSHRDDAIAAGFAKRFSQARKATVTVTVGIHIDDASAREIARLNENSVSCLCSLLAQTEELK